MFKCDNCGKQTSGGEKQNKVASIIRHKEYENFKVKIDPKTRKKKKEYFTTQGYETSEELNFCDECFKLKEENGDESRTGSTNQSVETRSKKTSGRNQAPSSKIRRVERNSLRNISGR